jgi:hypothetical protein
MIAENIPFLLLLKYVLKRYLQKGKTGQAISYRDSRLSAQGADRRLAKKGDHESAVTLFEKVLSVWTPVCQKCIAPVFSRGAVTVPAN